MLFGGKESFCEIGGKEECFFELEGLSAGLFRIGASSWLSIAYFPCNGLRPCTTAVPERNNNQNALPKLGRTNETFQFIITIPNSSLILRPPPTLSPLPLTRLLLLANPKHFPNFTIPLFLVIFNPRIFNKSRPEAGRFSIALETMECPLSKLVEVSGKS